jgi:hypothetical protein
MNVTSIAQFTNNSPLSYMHQPPHPNIISEIFGNWVDPNAYSLEDNQLLNNPPYKPFLPLKELVFPGTRLSKSHPRKSSQPPRPQNRYILFKKDCDARRRHLSHGSKVDSKEISKLTATIWHSDEGLKIYFSLLARIASDLHKKLYPEYAYKPNKSPRKRKEAKELRIKQYSIPNVKTNRKKLKEISSQQVNEDYVEHLGDNEYANGQSFSNGNPFSPDNFYGASDSLSVIDEQATFISPPAPCSICARGEHLFYNMIY